MQPIDYATGESLGFPSKETQATKAIQAFASDGVLAELTKRADQLHKNA